MQNPSPKLPDEIIETVRQALSDGEAYQWRLGDLLNDVVSEWSRYYDPADARRARAAIIRELATATGADTSTLRDRQCMSAFYSVPVRQEFDALSYSQLRACKAAGERWREYAEWALGNLPAPVALIRARIRNGGADAPAWCGRWERVQELAALLAEDEKAPEVIRRWCASVPAQAI